MNPCPMMSFAQEKKSQQAPEIEERCLLGVIKLIKTGT